MSVQRRGQRGDLSPNLAVVLVAIVGIIVPLVTAGLDFVQRQNIAETQRERDGIVADHVEQTRMDLAKNTTAVEEKLEKIHVLVNSQLTQAVNRFREATDTIRAMRAVMLKIAPSDPRVQELLKAEDG